MRKVMLIVALFLVVTLISMTALLAYAATYQSTVTVSHTINQGNYNFTCTTKLDTSAYTGTAILKLNNCYGNVPDYFFGSVYVEGFSGNYYGTHTTMASSYTNYSYQYVSTFTKQLQCSADSKFPAVYSESKFLGVTVKTMIVTE